MPSIYTPLLPSPVFDETASVLPASPPIPPPDIPVKRILANTPGGLPPLWLRSHWLAAEDLEMAGLIKRKVWERVLRSVLLPSDTIFQTRFHYKIKRKGGKFEKCKVRLLVRGDRMTKKDDS